MSPRFKVVHQILKISLPVFVKNDISAPDVENMSRQHAVAAIENATFLQVAYRAIEHFIDVELFMRLMGNLDVHRTGAFRCHRF